MMLGRIPTLSKAALAPGSGACGTRAFWRVSKLTGTGFWSGFRTGVETVPGAGFTGEFRAGLTIAFRDGALRAEALRAEGFRAGLGAGLRPGCGLGFNTADDWDSESDGAGFAAVVMDGLETRSGSGESAE
jgi:hypothetical protein